LLLCAVACDATMNNTPPSSSAASPAAAASSSAASPAAAASSSPSKDAEATPTSRSSEIPPGSGDYSAVLAEVGEHKRGAISFEELKKRLLARKLPPHPLGCGYLMTPAPVPPPGVKFDPRMMPKDWEHNWGEVAMVYWLGKLTREEYDKLHAAAHPKHDKP
jgi:hypothetical protein